MEVIKYFQLIFLQSNTEILSSKKGDNIKMSESYDLLILGAGCVGMAAAYYAAKMNKRVCVVERGAIQEENRIWSSGYGSTQNRIQYNEEYIARMILASNTEWRQLQKQLGCTLLHQQGVLWFGDKDYDSYEGKITTSSGVLSQINSNIPQSKKIDFMFMQKIHPSYPEFMKAFKPITYRGQKHSEWKKWSALYQPDGGYINSKLAYNLFLKFIRQRPQTVTIHDRTTVLKHQIINSEYKHQFTLTDKQCIRSKTVLVAVGLHTPHFLKNIMHYPYFVDNNYKNGQKHKEYSIHQSVVSHIEVQNGYEDFYSKIPAFYNLQKPDAHYEKFSAYGFPLQKENGGQQGNFIKIGTQISKTLDSPQEEEQYLNKSTYAVPQSNDFRVEAALRFAKERMNHLLPQSSNNKHSFSSNIYFTGKDSLLDYLQTKDKTVVVLAGGQIGKCHALLAKTAVRMLMDPEAVAQEMRDETVIGSYLKRTRLPLKTFVHDQLTKYSLAYPQNGRFKTVIIGAGCSGLYAAYRLNQTAHNNIGVFDLSERISGRLKSFNFHGTSTPMELGGMRYIPANHVLVNQIIQNLGVASLDFETEGDPIQNYMRKAYLRGDHYQMNQWEATQEANGRLHTAYRLHGHIVGMNAFQIMSYSFYQIITAPENIHLITEIFLAKTDEEINSEKAKLAALGQSIHAEESYYRTWENYLYCSPQNTLNYNINLSLHQWNQLKPILLFRIPSKIDEISSKNASKTSPKMYPLYKFGFQNVLEGQFGHQAYQFVAEQNGYYSNTSNASYLDQVMTYLLDFGKVKYRTLHGGFDSINYAMAKQLLDDQLGMPARNGGIFLRHKLVNIEKCNKNYLLTFHLKTADAPQDSKFQTELLSGVKRSKLAKLKHTQLGELVALPDKPGYFSVQFLAEKLILGMPKKSIEVLSTEIQLLQQPLTNYDPIYQADHKSYEEIFSYPQLEALKHRSGEYCSLSEDEHIRRDELLEQQAAFFEDNDKPNLSQEQAVELNQLSERYLYTTYLNNITLNHELQVQKKECFNKDKPIAPKTIAELAGSSQSMPAMKIVMNFTKNWWDPNIMFNHQYQKKNKHANLVNRFQQMRGVSVTDLPIRQTLYFSTGNQHLLLASYNDMNTTEFWSTLHNNFEKVWEPTTQVQREIKQGNINQILQYPKNCEIHPAKEVLVREALKQLSQIHNLNVKEEWVKECIYQFWGNDIFGGGYHNFHSGYYIPSVMQCMRKPWKEESIHFVGQAYSNETGWVQGAFQTAQKLLQEEFGLQPLVHGYYAGY